MKKTISLIVMITLLVGILASCSPSDTSSDTTADATTKTTAKATEEEFTEVKTADVEKLISDTPGLIIIDMSDKYAAGHLPNAVNYYVGDGSLDTAIPTLDMSKAYLVYSHNDSDTTSGARKLIDAGFKSVYSLSGNYAAWFNEGYPLEK